MLSPKRDDKIVKKDPLRVRPVRPGLWDLGDSLDLGGAYNRCIHCSSGLHADCTQRPQVAQSLQLRCI